MSQTLFSRQLSSPATASGSESASGSQSQEEKDTGPIPVSAAWRAADALAVTDSHGHVSFFRVAHRDISGGGSVEGGAVPGVALELAPPTSLEEHLAMPPRAATAAAQGIAAHGPQLLRVLYRFTVDFTGYELGGFVTCLCETPHGLLAGTQRRGVLQLDWAGKVTGRLDLPFLPSTSDARRGESSSVKRIEYAGGGTSGAQRPVFAMVLGGGQVVVASGALNASPVTCRLPVEHGPYAEVAVHLVRGSSHDVYVAASSTNPRSSAIAEVFIFHVHFDARLEGASATSVTVMARPSLRPWICSDDSRGERARDGGAAPVGLISCLSWSSSVDSCTGSAALAVGYADRGLAIFSDDGCRTMTTLPRMLSTSEECT